MSNKGKRPSYGRGKPQGQRGGRAQDSRGSYQKGDRPGGGDRPYQKSDYRPREDRPYQKSDYRPREDRPYQKSDYRPREDRPYQKNDYRPREDRPYQKSDYRPREDRPYQKNDYKPREDRPYQKSDYRPREDRPYQKSDYRPREDRPYGKGPAQRDRRPDFGRPASPARAVDEAPIGDRPEASVPQENLLVGRNPIREALKAGRHFEALYVVKGDINGSAREIVRVAKEKRVIVKEVDRRALDNMAVGHQGLVAVVSAHQYSTVEDMLALARSRGEDPLLVLLDGITDPHNFGAISRTAECCGAHGVIICERRAVGMTPGAAKAAAGAFEHIPIARVTNVSRAIDELKAAGLWIYAADQGGGQSCFDSDLKGPIAIVIGDEGDGISRLALEKCDAKVVIPIRGEIESLNASVAAGILLYEVTRQRDAK